MCKKNPSDCQAKMKCKCCTVSDYKHHSMSEIRKAYTKAKDTGQVKSYKISVDSNEVTQSSKLKFCIDSVEEHDKISLDIHEVDKLQTETDNIVIVKIGE